MKITILLKSGPDSDEAGRALQTAADMLDQGHSVVLYLLQEAVRFCRPSAECSNTATLHRLIAKDLAVMALTGDAELRGLEVEAAGLTVTNGTYESLVDLMTSSDRIVGVL